MSFLAALSVCAAVGSAVMLEYSADTDVSVLTDSSYETVFEIPEAGLDVSLTRPAFAAYIVWNTPTGCTIQYDGGEAEADGTFLHQFVSLDGAEELRLLPEKSTELCELYFFSEGSLPPGIQCWKPVSERCDLLLLPAHADDELLMFGGTMPYYAGELGLIVQVSYMTNHWGEQPRPHELLDGLWACGVRNYPVISEFPDIPCWSLAQAKRVFDEEEVLKYQVETIRRTKPSVIIAHDIDGEYGHGAHMLDAYTLQRALELTADETAYPESAEKWGVWDVPKAYLHFWKENTIEMDWERPLESFGGITAREAAANAYLLHRSQQKWGYSVNYGEDWDCRQFGLYRSLVGIDSSADFMENVTSVAEERRLAEEKCVKEARDAERLAEEQRLEAQRALTEKAVYVPKTELPQTDEEVPVQEEAENDNLWQIFVLIGGAALAAFIIYIILRVRKGS